MQEKDEIPLLFLSFLSLDFIHSMCGGGGQHTKPTWTHNDTPSRALPGLDTRGGEAAGRCLRHQACVSARVRSHSP